MSKCSFLMVLLLAFPIIRSSAAYADYPPQNTNCVGEPVGPAEYQQLIDALCMGADIINQAFDTPFGGCEEGLASLELMSEPRFDVFVETCPGENFDGIPTQIMHWVRYCQFGQVIEGQRHLVDGSSEPFTFVPLDYVIGDSVTDVPPECGATNVRYGHLFGRLQGPAGNVPVEGLLLQFTLPGDGDIKVFQLVDQLSAAQLEYYDWYQGFLLNRMGLPHVSYCMMDGPTSDPLSAQRMDTATHTLLGTAPHAGGLPIMYEGPCNTLDCCKGRCSRTFDRDCANAENTLNNCLDTASKLVLVHGVVCFGLYGWFGLVGGVKCLVSLIVVSVSLLANCYSTHNSNLQNARNNLNACLDACYEDYAQV